MENWEIVLKYLSDFRKRGLIISNFYPNQEEMERWIKNNSFNYYKLNDTIPCFVHKVENIYHVYYFLEGFEYMPDFLDAVNKFFPNENIAYDSIFNSENDVKMAISLNKNEGFYCRTELRRMSFILKDNTFSNDKNVSFANKNEIKEIISLFNASFDMVSERIPDEDEFNIYCKNQQVLILKEGNQIVGCAVIEIQKKTMYLKYLVTNPHFRKQGVATRLLNTAFYMAKNCMRFILWVKIDNEVAINLYRKFGYKEENLWNITFYRGA